MKTPPTDPFAALRYKEFTFYGLGSFFFTTAILIQEVVLGYQIYRITHDPLALGLVGLAEAIPYISLALLGGHLADKYDKKTIILLSLSVILAGSFILHWATLPETRAIHDDRFLLMIIYSVVALIGFARGFYSPATASLKAFLTPREVYANAASWYSTFWQTGAILGPGLAGFLYSWMGMSGTMWLVIASIGIVFILFSFIKKKPIPIPSHEEVGVWQSIREGIGFVFGSKILLYSISLDLVAVLFGGVVAILPVFAEDVLKVGAEGLGILRAAPSVGAVLTIIGTAVYSPVKKAWLNMLIAVAGFGLATIVFALSTHFWLSVSMLFLTGAFDSISVVIRQAILQLVPPDEIRGRVLSVNSIFVSTSNEIGAFESGVLAKAFGAVPSVLIGGSLTMVIVGIIWIKTKELLHVKLI